MLLKSHFLKEENLFLYLLWLLTKNGELQSKNCNFDGVSTEKKNLFLLAILGPLTRSQEFSLKKWLIRQTCNNSKFFIRKWRSKENIKLAVFILVEVGSRELWKTDRLKQCERGVAIWGSSARLSLTARPTGSEAFLCLLFQKPGYSFPSGIGRESLYWIILWLVSRMKGREVPAPTTFQNSQLEIFNMVRLHIL